MPNELRSLDVQFVSLVDRAAVRDPSNPDEPQRFLLFKRDSAADTEPERETMPVAQHSAAFEKATESALEARDRLGVSLANLEQVRPTGDAYARHAVAKASRQVQLEYLRQMSPNAAAAAEGAVPAPGASQAHAIAVKAEEIRKADSSLSPYEAMLRAAGDRDAQRAYLESVR